MGRPIAFMVANSTRSELICTRCGAKFVVFRDRGSMRGNGHVKHLWCHQCQEVTEHTEVQST